MSVKYKSILLFSFVFIFWLQVKSDELNTGLICFGLGDIAKLMDEVESAELNYKQAIEYLQGKKALNLKRLMV
jgi:hypothetical protein